MNRRQILITAIISTTIAALFIVCWAAYIAFLLHEGWPKAGALYAVNCIALSLPTILLCIRGAVSDWKEYRDGSHE